MKTNRLSEIGQYVDEQIRYIQVHHPYCEIPLWVVMPNHIHLIVYIDETKIPWTKRDTSQGLGFPVSSTQYATQMQSWLSVVIRQFKQCVTRFANERTIPFGWQARFHDHIIRNQGEFDRIAYYIANNVNKWNMDCFRR